MVLTTTKVGHPVVDAWRYPLPEDTVIFRIANDSDPDGDPLTVMGTNTNGTLGSVTDNGDGTFDYDHPVFGAAAMEAQKNLWKLQGHNRTWFCGSYFGFGFHEDGAQSGLAVAEQLGGVRRPWKVGDESGRIALDRSLRVEAAE